ncbi:1,4-dihydroxy-2-naphthoyl-CoA synthase [Cutibacterium sp. WCA-380-WT-3A]|uniref:1,4-dihydroxy-2-naphthoyl-CoA synthase n=1 Tax=Cutibacterium porci TaxID=2605781 RepID=A0A7K0J711_9ACTN|nr:1,4-dihydroxy-2-naphthoyl-CoA synthase [Cutibacterium porci]
MSTLPFISDTFDAHRWRDVDIPGEPLTDMTFHRLVSRGESDHAPAGEDLPVVRIAFDRPAIRNAFRPHTVDELYRCIDTARCSPDVAAIILTGNGPSPRDGGYSFCSGGDQRIRGAAGYQYESDESAGDEDLAVDARREKIAKGRLGRLHILEVQRLMRATPKPIIAAIPGWTTGGGHSLMVVADMAVASREHARFKQVDANVGSFDAGYGSALLARQIGDKRAREIFFLAETYDADQAEKWGVINRAVDHAELENTAIEWGLTIAGKSPQAIRMLKYAFNMVDDGIAGQQAFAGEATRMAYMTDEAQEGRDAFLEHRQPDWSSYPYYF